jgi:hypothetical protein
LGQTQETADMRAPLQADAANSRPRSEKTSPQSSAQTRHVPRADHSRSLAVLRLKIQGDWPTLAASLTSVRFLIVLAG